MALLLESFTTILRVTRSPGARLPVEAPALPAGDGLGGGASDLLPMEGFKQSLITDTVDIREQAPKPSMAMT